MGNPHLAFYHSFSSAYSQGEHRATGAHQAGEIWPQSLGDSPQSVQTITADITGESPEYAHIGFLCCNRPWSQVKHLL